MFLPLPGWDKRWAAESSWLQRGVEDQSLLQVEPLTPAPDHDPVLVTHLHRGTRN